MTILLSVNELNLLLMLFWKAYIIAHVPMGYLPFATGTTAVREGYNERLVEIFRKYSDVVAGHFYGHTHRDSIMVLLDHKGKATPLLRFRFVFQSCCILKQSEFDDIATIISTFITFDIIKHEPYWWSQDFKGTLLKYTCIMHMNKSMMYG